MWVARISHGVAKNGNEAGTVSRCGISPGCQQAGQRGATSYLLLLGRNVSSILEIGIEQLLRFDGMHPDRKAQCYRQAGTEVSTPVPAIRRTNIYDNRAYRFGADSSVLRQFR